MVEPTMQPGSLVLLKSGGPLMTVQSVDQSGVTCTWFDKNNLKTMKFPAVTLELYVEPNLDGNTSWIDERG
jgi:uncharacterized protein YodC (DUF2158 family)